MRKKRVFPSVVVDIPQLPPVSTEIFYSSGSTTLDMALGSGWAKGLIHNIWGNEASGKTLLAISACKQFNLSWPDEPILYIDSERRLNWDYARTLGFPNGAELVNDCSTIEDFHDRIVKMAEKGEGFGGLVVLDSLDALEDEMELGRTMSEKAMPATKARKMSEAFRRLGKPLHESGITLLILSQVRENIGVVYGNQYVRAGGKALDFYASQIVSLTIKGKEKLVRKVGPGKTMERVVGVSVEATVRKNSVAPPWRKALLKIFYNRGLDDIESILAFFGTVGYEKTAKDYFPDGHSSEDDVRAGTEAIKKDLRDLYTDIETVFIDNPVWVRTHLEN
jgi:recombination protein RecA